MSDLTDLNPLSPTGTDPVSDGDNELRALKNALVGDGTALQGSFTPTFTGQYTGTAAELNAVNTAIQPTDDLDALNDVTYSPDPPTVGDHLVYGAGGWANVTPVTVTAPGSARYAGYSASVGAQPYFTTEVRNNIPAALAVVKNDGTGGFGWTVTAAARVLVTLSYEVVQILLTTAEQSYLSAGIGLNTVGTALDDSAMGGQYSGGGLIITGASGTFRRQASASATVSIVLEATDVLTVSYDSKLSSVDYDIYDANLNLSVTDAS